ncbi:MAG: hypothetical protein Kow0063_07970 [Anaerolineae bacterium]
MGIDPGSTINVQIRLLGFLAQAAKRAEIELVVEPGSTVADLMHLLAERVGPELRQSLLDRHGNPHGGLEIVLNGQLIPVRKISEFSLWDDSQLIIIPLVGGG